MNKTLLALGAVVLAPLGLAVHAQSPALTARSFVSSPAALGMGDAGVAFATPGTAFFYNPAHLATAAGLKPRINLLGLRVQGTTNLKEQYDFFDEELKPAIDRGIENLSTDERVRLYNEALELGGTRTYAGSDVLLPNVTMQVAGIGVGGGMFARNLVRYRISDAGAGVPNISFAGQSDLTALASGAVDFGRYGLAGLAAGVTAKYTRRFLTLKDKPIDAFSENESIYLLKGDNVGFDAGFTYALDAIPVPGRITLGAAVYDVAASGFDYEDADRVLYGDDANVDPATVEDEIALANRDFELSPSYRVGAAYTVPSLFGLFRETGFALDYQGYSDPFVEGQSFLTRLHAGAQVRLARVLAVRAGLGQGYTSAGAGLAFGPIRLDYAFFGQEDGRMPGQVPSWNHTLQLAFAL